MKQVSTSFAVLAALVLVAGCERQEAGIGAAAGTDVVMTLPVTTASDAAREDFLSALYAADMGRGNEANALFEKAVEADPEFAMGYLMKAGSATSTEEFTTNLAKAVEHKATASPAEQLLIDIMQQGFENNAEGQLATAQELVSLQPESPRALLRLAGIQSGLNQIAESRATINQAITLAPDMAAAHMQLGNNYLFLEPKDFTQAELAFQKAVELVPNEATPYDLMGDVHRAQGNLAAAAEDYTMAAERAPANGSPLQQRGHVHSFLGNYDEARADYTQAMEIETARGNNNAPFFGVFRAYVNLHEGNPDAAITELRELAAGVDATDMEGKTDLKINALTNIVQIAMHYGDYETAEASLADLSGLLRQQADEVGTDAFRRGQEATIAYWAGMIAARQGNADVAKAKAAEFATLLEPDPNPRKLEPMHQILGITEFYQKDYAAAEEHLAAGNPNNIYMQYYQALCHEQTGKAEEAKQIFSDLAVYNFNGVNYAMIRRDVLALAGM